ncbi:MAG: signal recognition particle protein [Clostridiaceae bacterium]|nr:signal recognition particle protein [Clostridiaceae bacterium]
MRFRARKKRRPTLFEGLSERFERFTRMIRGKSRITEKDIKEAMRTVRTALIEADVNYDVVKEFTDTVAEACRGSKVTESLTPGQEIIKVVHEELVNILGGAPAKLTVSPSGFTVIMLFGLQGSGKTTASAKLGLHLKKQGKRPLLVSVDTHRPAAAHQLAILAQAADVPSFIKPEEKDAVQIAREGVARARYLMCDTLIVDTAGRMTIDSEMMQELRAIANVVKPTERLLTVDAMIGQEAVNIAVDFDRQIGLDGFIMTKLDGDARGGAALSIYKVTKKPIKFASVGEKVEDLEPFYPDRMASRILGMGDVLSLIEKATATVDERAARDTMRNIRRDEFTMQDMLMQFEQVQKMGPVQDILSMIPGMGKKAVQQSDVDDRSIVRNIAIIRSMTMAERYNVRLLNASRRRRIATGSGTTVQDVNILVRQYESTKQMMKQFGGGRKGRKGGRKGRGRGGFPGFPGLGM